MNPITQDTTDSDLVQRAKAGYLDAFEALTTRYERRVYSLAFASCARSRTLRTSPSKPFSAPWKTCTASGATPALPPGSCASPPTPPSR
jgi:hypothetical protein